MSTQNERISCKEEEKVALEAASIQKELNRSQPNHPCADLSPMVASKGTQDSTTQTSALRSHR